MNYKEFKVAYTSIFNRMMSYKPTECGASIYAEKLAFLADSYPDFESQMENELENA